MMAEVDKSLDLFEDTPTSPGEMVEEEGRESEERGQKVANRLMISKIVCRDFKSYAGEKELGPFHKCFTSIVGPNGSGKSNVIDSMLFVFGYRASHIRSKRVSVLIHNSENHQNIPSCTVSVHFQKIIDLPGDEYEVVSGSQFIVSRTAFKDNSSHYQLNGRKVPLKEVAALLRGSGIDLDHNRFLILQGEVEQIALMKPKAQSEHSDGMLEFLEDIVGTSSLKEPIEELAKKVEELGEARGEKLNRVKAAEKEKVDLEGAKDEAEYYLSLQRDKAMKQHTLYSKYIMENEGEAEKSKEAKERFEARVKAIQETLTKQSANKKEKLSAQKKALKLYEKLGEEEEQCKGKIASCETRDVRARQDLKNTKNNLKKMAKSLEKEQEKLVELEATPDKLSKEVETSRKKLVVLEARIVDEEKKLTGVMEGLKTATKDMQQEKEGMELKLVDLNKILNEAKSKHEVSLSELTLYMDKFTSCEKQLQEAREKQASIQREVQAKEKQLASTERALPGKKKELTKTEGELKVVNEAFVKLNQQYRDGRSQIEEARSSFESHKRHGQVLRSLMEQRDSGNIPGIHGRLGDLGAIDEQYDIAISTACGPLDNIVVDTMDTAVKCVEFLRKNNVGVATFIGLDKIEHLRNKAASKISTPQGVPRLFDLVRSKDPRFLTAFYYALRDTLVAQDLNQATRIGLQGRTRNRVVTLSGQLVDISGTMSGGGNRPIKGRMSSKLQSDISPQELRGMEERLGSDEKALQDCVQRRNTLEERATRLRSEVKSMEGSLKQLSRDLELMRVQSAALSERIGDLEKQAADNVMDPAHLAKLEKQVAAFDKERKKAATSAGGVQDQVNRLHEAIMEVGGSRMQSQQAQVTAVKKDIDSTNAAIAKANVGAKTAERNAGKSRKKIASLEEEMKEMNARKEGLKNTLTSLEDEAREILAKQEEIRENVVKHEKTLQHLKSDIEGLEEEEGGVQESLLDLRHELEKYSTSLRDSEKKMKYYQNELKKLDVGESPPPELTQQELVTVDKDSVQGEVRALEKRLEQMTPNMAAIQEYKRKEELYARRLRDLDGVTGERDSARRDYEGMRKERLDKFMAGFSVITNKLKEMYQMITLGGDAELELVDSLDPFSEGIVFSVRPPKKSWKNISNLSGGEKTLSSLALVFALHHYKPSPLYVMDEIDAALDFKNVSIVAHYIKERTKNAQFIIISLRNNMFELADRLVGIYKTDNCTKSVTVDPYKITQAIGGPKITSAVVPLTSAA